ncbi:Putative zinc-or iron-chelating domain-containing protein [Geoalkalibacter ferrihydriticus]|uniref:Putative zinc-or iron-chelating domain-containing protein n=1 Tax=Geoalkalibacter ferrihydriticus TaxID=392333 RepID=A0A1G9X967_9BACT|nr:YkgJ family cysteine cluster protein [Geoalkalibacter ferrihydriticus]SDM93310.1 Putative zinc-or iron-chelating domain-containing protein [Geoalkalibacter ferrihydriticus]
MSELREEVAAYGRHLAHYDRWFERCLQRFSQRIRCAAGCSACCRALFDISLLDAALLQEGLRRLPAKVQTQVAERAWAIIARLQQRWPGFDHPFTLNHLPEDQWEVPEEDDTPCPLLDAQGRCLVYAYRPATCRLHGLPNIDEGGEVFQAQSCSHNFPGEDALEILELRADFRTVFREEAHLYRRFAEKVWGSPEVQADTFIAAVPFIDFTVLGARKRHDKL